MNDKKDPQGQDPLDDALLKELGLEPRDTKTKETILSESAQENSDDEFFYGDDEDEDEAEEPAIASAPPVGPKAPAPPAKVPAPKVAPPKVAPPKVLPPMDPQSGFKQGLVQLSRDLPLQVVAVLGKKSMTLKEVLNLKQGEIIELKKMPQDMIDLVANGKLLARGELVLVDGKLGIQIKQIVSS